MKTKCEHRPKKNDARIDRFWRLSMGTELPPGRSWYFLCASNAVSEFLLNEQFSAVSNGQAGKSIAWPPHSNCCNCAVMAVV